MTGLKFMAGASALGIMDAVPADSGWEKVGIVTLLICAIVFLRRDERRQQVKLEQIIERNSAALSENAETRRETNTILVEFKTAIDKCRKG